MEAANSALIRVVGVGGGGVNAVNRMIESNLRGVEFIAVNTDLQVLMMTDADVKLEIGEAQTRGLGAGADPEVGKRAATDHIDAIKEILEGSDMVFVTAGEGGGTGTGGAPVVAQVARELGALTIGVVTRPFDFEGRQRARQAERGIEELRQHVDALIVIPNQRLLDSTDANLSLLDAFQAADQVLQSAVQGITEIITIPGVINVDFADVKSTLRDAGTALMGIGSATGAERALDAVEMAISSPLLETSMEGANRVLLFVQGGLDVTMSEVNRAADMVRQIADPEANVIFGFAPNETFGDEIRVTVVAAGFAAQEVKPARKAEAAESPITRPTRSAPVEASTADTSAGETTSKDATVEKDQIVESVAARLANHRAERPVVPELKAPTLPSVNEAPAGTEAIAKEKLAFSARREPEVKITGLSGVAEVRNEPLAVTSGIRPVSPDATTVPNYVDSSRDQTVPVFQMSHVFDDMTGKDEIDIPDFLR